MIIGIDFDNTIVCYDGVFHKVAVESDLITNEVGKTKNEVRDYLRSIGKEDAWTELQGIVYGPRILDANPFPGVLEFFMFCKKQEIKIYIISHKTLHPFIGEKHNLHNFARKWLKEKGFLESIKEENIFFQLTMDEKINKISELNCNYFIDDLPEVLNKEGFRDINRILFDPNNQYNTSFLKENSWQSIKKRFTANHLLSKLGINNYSEKKLSGGRNNKVSHLTSPGKEVLLKEYFLSEFDRRKRCKTEFDFCKFAWDNKISCIAQPLESDREHIALYNFISGTNINKEDINRNYVNQAITFFQNINEHKHSVEALTLPNASEACFTIKEHLNCVENRLIKLKEMPISSLIDKEAKEFINNQLDSKWQDIKNNIISFCVDNQIDLDKTIKQEDKFLSPSDFGFHNAILKNGKIHFIDFEYAGWDDPAKTICDFFCQPQIPVDISYFDDFKNKVCLDDITKQRVDLLMPVYIIKWTSIILNEFLKDNIERRNFSSGNTSSEEKKKEQLSKAKIYLKRLDNEPNSKKICNNNNNNNNDNDKFEVRSDDNNSKEMDIMTSLHKGTSRDYISRMNDDKINCMEIARKYEQDYWDGDRKYGYGGYKYMPGRWEPVARKIIKKYNLTNQSKVLDVGCGKGFLLYEIKQILPNCEIVGFDISKHAVEKSKEEIRSNIKQIKAQDNYPYDDNYFDVVISITTLHNLHIFDLKKALQEIERVGKNKYVMVESYRNSKELFNLECWALTAECFFTPQEWIWIYNEFGYNGDYEFIYFE